MLNLYSLLFLIWPLFGWAALRTLLGISSLVYLLPFSFVLGLASFLVLVYGLAFFFGIQKGALLSLLILFTISIVLMAIFKKEFFKIENPLKLPEIITLLCTCLFIGFFTYLISEKWIMWDFKFHISVASYFVSTDKFPNVVSNWPTLFIPYHYGFNLLSATIVKLTNISVIDSFHLIIVYSSIITFLSCFAIAYFFVSKCLPHSLRVLSPPGSPPHFRNKFLSVDPSLPAPPAVNGAAFISGLLFYFSGNLLWLDSIIRFLFKIPPVEKGWSFFQAFCACGMHGSIMNDLGSGGILFGSNTIGIQFFLLLLFLFLNYLDLSSISIKYLILIFITSLALFHSAEWILYLFLLALIFSPILSFLIKDGLDREKLIQRNLACALIFIFIVLFNGIAYKLMSRGYSYLPSFLEFSINPKLFSLEVFGRFGDLNKHRNLSLFSWGFISEFGLQFIFSIFVLYWLIKKRIKGTNFILSFFLISFFSPFLFYIKTSPPDVIRLFHPAFELLTLFFGLWLFDLGRGVLQYAPTLSFAVILPSIVTLTLSGIFSPGIYLSHLYIGFVNFSLSELKKDWDITKFYKNVAQGISFLRSGAVISTADIKVGEYLKNHSKKDEYGVSYSSLPFDFVGIPCYAVRGSSYSRRVTFITILNTFDPYLLKELKIKWFLLDPETATVINPAFVEEQIKKGYLKEVIKEKNPLVPEIELRLFEIVNTDEYMKNNPRKTYWTFLSYLGDDVIPIEDSSGNRTVYLFKSEKEATDFLKEEIKINPEFKKYKPCTNAVDGTILKEQAVVNNLSVKYAG